VVCNKLAQKIYHTTLSCISSVGRGDTGSVAAHHRAGVKAEMLDYSDVTAFNGSFSCS
jgi:hypothetical protein